MGDGMEKFLWVLKSRKFWASVIGLAVSFGLLRTSELQETELIEAILTIVTVVSYVIGTAVEDAGRHSGE